MQRLLSSPRMATKVDGHPQPPTHPSISQHHMAEACVSRLDTVGTKTWRVKLTLTAVFFKITMATNPIMF